MKEVFKQFLKDHFERLVYMMLGTVYSIGLITYGITQADDTVKGVGIGFFTAIVGISLNKMRTPKNKIKDEE